MNRLFWTDTISHTRCKMPDKLELGNILLELMAKLQVKSSEFTQNLWKAKKSSQTKNVHFSLNSTLPSHHMCLTIYYNQGCVVGPESQS